jgi:hypothetical protein
MNKGIGRMNPTLSLFLCSQSPPASQIVFARASSFFTPCQSWYRMANLKEREQQQR